MEHFSFLEGLILFLIGLLFFKEQLVPAVMSKFGVNIKKLATSEQVDTLTEHFNHETTELLTEIRDDLRIMSEGVKTINRRQDEWERYVFPTLCKKKDNNK